MRETDMLGESVYLSNDTDDVLPMMILTKLSRYVDVNRIPRLVFFEDVFGQFLKPVKHIFFRGFFLTYDI